MYFSNKNKKILVFAMGCLVGCLLVLGLVKLKSLFSPAAKIPVPLSMSTFQEGGKTFSLSVYRIKEPLDKCDHVGCLDWEQVYREVKDGKDKI